MKQQRHVCTPNGTFASEFLGRAEAVENKKDGSYSLIGQTGLERSLNSLLTGTDGEAIYEKDKNGNTLLGTEPLPRKLSMVRTSIQPCQRLFNLPRNTDGYLYGADARCQCFSDSC